MNYPHKTHFLTHLCSLIISGTGDRQKKYLKLFIKPSNEDSYNVGGNFPSGFRREEKIENRKHPF